MFPLAPLMLGGSLLGGLFGGNQNQLDPATLQKFFGIGALSNDTQALYNLLSQSPQFRQMLLQNAIQGQQFQNNLAQGLGERGLSTSGIGTIANAAGQSAISSGASALRGGLFGEAGNMAQQNLLARLNAYTQGQYGQMQRPTGFQQFFGSTLAALPYLMGNQQQQGGGALSARSPLLGGGLGGTGAGGFTQSGIPGGYGGYVPGQNFYPNYLYGGGGVGTFPSVFGK